MWGLKVVGEILGWPSTSLWGPMLAVFDIWETSRKHGNSQIPLRLLWSYWLLLRLEKKRCWTVNEGPKLWACCCFFFFFFSSLFLKQKVFCVFDF